MISSKYSERLLVASAEMKSYDDESGDTSKAGKGSSKKHDGGNCISRLFFSNCWAGSKGCKNTCNKVKKGACPAYTSCPCGADAPCAKKGEHPDNHGGNGRGNQGKHGKGHGRKRCKDNPLSNLCGKAAPCIFGPKKGHGKGHGDGKSGWRCVSCLRLKHKHTPCCCRCSDNPQLPDSKHKSDAGHTRKKPSEDEWADAEGQKDQYIALGTPKEEGTDPTQQPIPCVGSDCDGIRAPEQVSGNKSKNVRPIKKVPKETQEIATAPAQVQCAEVLTSSEKSKKEIAPVDKSSSNVPILFKPTITNELESELVNHQILKTISTIHGPMRVEQKIVVKRHQNPGVVITHGGMCECNLCSTLKNKSVANNSPRIVCFKTDKGSCMFVDHSDNCRCNLCSTLEQGLTDGTPANDLVTDAPAPVLKAGWSTSSQIKQFEDKDEPEWKEFVPNAIEMSTSQEYSSHDGINNIFSNHKIGRSRTIDTDKHKKKNCHCFKCLRRRVKRLKRKLRKTLGSKVYLEELRNFSQHSFEQISDSENNNENENCSENDVETVVYKPFNKRVSFAKEPNLILNPREDQASTTPVDSAGRRGQRNRGKQRGEKKSNVRSYIIVSHQSDESAQISMKMVESRKKRKHDQPCDCLVCNTSRSVSREGKCRAVMSSALSNQQRNGDEEQSCFPQWTEQKSFGNNADADRKDDLTTTVIDQITHPETEFIRPTVRCEPACKSPCRNLTPLDELSRLGVLPQAFELNSKHHRTPKILYWQPSNSNLAASFRSESFYIPDSDDFPTTDKENLEQNSRSRRSRTPEDLKRELEEPPYCTKNFKMNGKENCH